MTTLLPAYANSLGPKNISGLRGRRLRRAASVLSLNSAFSQLSSSTMTASDLPGPGRLLDKYVFTRGGRALERAIARVAHSLGFGPAAAALRIGANLKGFSLQDSPSSESLTSSEITTRNSLRLELGLVHDIPRLGADCKKLFHYTKSSLASTRIQALTMIITLYIRFPYLSSYFDSSELTEHAHRGGFSFSLPKDDALEDCLSRMAFACLVPVDNVTSVSRLVDHLAEQTKLAEENARPQSSGPWYLLLPNTRMIRKYCENSETSFASLRFTGIIFRHSFLSRADEYYVKLNRATMPGFWRDLIDCIDHLIRAELTRPCQCSCLRHCLKERTLACVLEGSDTSSPDSDLEGIDLFSEVVFEMLYRALAWDPFLRKLSRRRTVMLDDLVRDAIEVFKSPLAQIFFPNTSYIALAKIGPQLEIVQSAYEVQKIFDCGPSPD